MEALTDDQLVKLQAVAERPRDRFLVGLLIATGMRIGEALGLRREDMHFLPRATELGCQLRGPHVHVKRRLNENGALAKSRFERAIPVTDEIAGLYADYQHERFKLVPDDSDMVFVNLYRPPLGRSMTYSNTKDLFDRLAGRAGFTVSPAHAASLGGNSVDTWRNPSRCRAALIGACVGVFDGAVSPSNEPGPAGCGRGGCRSAKAAAVSVTAIALDETRFPLTAWVEWLEQQIDPNWRSDEWDIRALLFTGNPDNENTGVYWCDPVACETPTRTQGICTQCTRTFRASGRGA